MALGTTRYPPQCSGSGTGPSPKRADSSLSPPLQLLARGDFRALLRHPRPDLRRPRPAVEVLFALRRADPLDRAFNAHLPLEGLPIEAERRPRVGRKLAPLAAQV